MFQDYGGKVDVDFKSNYFSEQGAFLLGRSIFENIKFNLRVDS